MQGISVKMKHKAANSFDMVKLVVQFIATTKGLILSNTEVFALTYFVVNGYNKITREELITNKLLKSVNAVANLVSKFRKYGIIQKTVKGESLCEDFNIPSKGIDGIMFNISILK